MHLNSQGIRLREARKTAGFPTAKSFIEKYNLKQSTYSAHESGRNALTLKSAKLYGNLLNIDPIWLMTGSYTESNTENIKTLYKKIIDNKTYSVDNRVPAENQLDFLQSIHGPDSIAFLHKIGLTSGMTVTDLSCYNGAMTCLLAEWVGSNGQINAFHDNKAILDQAVIKAQTRNITNIVFNHINFDALNRPIALPNTDIIYSRFFLHRINNTDEILMKIKKSMSPNTLLVLECCTHKYFELLPEGKSFNIARKLLLNYGASENLDYNIGESIYRKLISHGFKVHSVHMVQPVAIAPHEKRMMEYITENLQNNYIKAGLCSQNEIETLMKELPRETQEDNATMLYTRTTQICASL